MKVGIVGASGYTGAELMRLLALHPAMELCAAQAQSHASDAVGHLYPSLEALYPGLHYQETDVAALYDLDCVFLALPHGESESITMELADRPSWQGVIVDLSADFRLKDAAAYEKWYGREHGASTLLAEFVYGLPEINAPALSSARFVAVPGCYPTAAILALWPFSDSGVLDTAGVIVDAASGVSGAGSSPSDVTHFSRVNSNFTAYGVLTHRHTPEIEQELGLQVTFVPHLAPMSRGILATCYGRLASDLDSEDAIELLRNYYSGMPFVTVTDEPPNTKAVLGSNCAHAAARVDRRNRTLVTMCAIDNLVKGASGQAIQCANIALGLPEDTGLPKGGLFP
ncbi:MAG: N-acetyl-gamma-glutamyl-phosphate reductase [Actinobacteria bacterium]|nr:N-acetyl-gamma-glutamyl-phosphate reductase [Actinomycetota bacterium]